MNDQLKDDPRYINHESRPDLAGEHPQGDRYQLYAFLLFTAAILIDHFSLGWAAHFRSIIPFSARLPLALMIILFGLFLSLSGIHTVFSEYTEQPRMITSGLFSFVRHPVYLGALLVYIGLLVFFLSPLALIVFIAVFFLYDWLAQDEEARMLKVFAQRYEDYRRQTPKWLPRLFRRN
jgi:protein-S-isoprenylcysteine O-methyltransferase Ste14